MAERSIIDIEKLVAALPPQEQARFHRVYAVSTSVGTLRIPPAMEEWAIKQFGSLETVARQKIVRLMNLVTGEEVLFNELRSSRPFFARCGESLQVEMAKAMENDVFRSPETDTSEDSFGRVAGKYCITASNVAKNDWLHGVVIFNDFNPLLFTREKVIDYLDTGWEWARRAHRQNPEAKYFLFFWNCLWRAGASMVHGHAQIMLASQRHYARIETLRSAALEYSRRHGASYFDDLYRIHEALGCAVVRNGVKILASLTPFKYNEIILMTEEFDLPVKELSCEVLAFLRDILNVTSFNFGLVTRPLAPTEESWDGFPVMVRIIDRGDPENRVADVGSIDIFGANLVVNDPFRLAQRLREYLG